MHHQKLVALLRAVLSTPTAPYHEYHVAKLVRQRLSAFPHVSVESDPFGNIVARYRRGRRRAAFSWAAHMDHPGWVRHRREPVFLGGVPAERLDSHEVEWFGDFGMWRLEPFALRDGLVHGRACDDLVGCAAILALFEELEALGAETTVYGIFTRAEEVGFVGAIEMAKRWPLPPGVSFVSLETSAPRGGVDQGGGPVVRVGDRTSVFDDGVTAELLDAASAAGIPHQRALLDGGSCEATAMNLYGVPAAGISIVLGNYHNCPPENGIAEEFVSLDDVKSLLRLIVAASTSPPRRGGGSKAQLRKRLAKRQRQNRPHERNAHRAWKEALK